MIEMKLYDNVVMKALKPWENKTINCFLTYSNNHFLKPFGLLYKYRQILNTTVNTYCSEVHFQPNLKNNEKIDLYIYHTVDNQQEGIQLINNQLIIKDDLLHMNANPPWFSVIIEDILSHLFNRFFIMLFEIAKIKNEINIYINGEIDKIAEYLFGTIERWNIYYNKNLIKFNCCFLNRPTKLKENDVLIIRTQKIDIDYNYDVRYTKVSETNINFKNKTNDNVSVLYCELPSIIKTNDFYLDTTAINNFCRYCNYFMDYKLSLN